MIRSKHYSCFVAVDFKDPLFYFSPCRVLLLGMNQLIWDKGGGRYTCDRALARTHKHTHTHGMHTHTHARGRQLGYASLSLSPLWLGSVPPKILERSEQASVAIRTRTSYRTVSFDSYAHRFLSFLCLLLSFCPPFLTVSLPPRCVVASLLYQMELHRLESYFHRERLAWSRTRDPQTYDVGR